MRSTYSCCLARLCSTLKTSVRRHFLVNFRSRLSEIYFNRADVHRGLSLRRVSLSYAQDCADLLGVEVQSKYPMSRDYPIIKCNISKHTGDRIYHLPFDQQYDATRIDLTAGEFYAKDVVEAENAGFRRAWRYNFR